MNSAAPRPDFGLSPRIERALEWPLCLWLIGCAIAFIAISARWPLVGDVTYLHYVIFLMHRGMAPYRDIVDMNLPGAYMLEGGVMATLGAGSLGWRIYDLLLILIASLSIFAILKPYGRVATISAATLFLMVHAQDGEIMAGERDFAAAVFLLAATALLFLAMRRMHIFYPFVALFGVLAGAAVTIKPTVVFVVLCLLAWSAWTLLRRHLPFLPASASALAGFSLPLIGTLLFLIRYNAVAAFRDALHGLIPYHASLAHRSFSFLIGHSVSPLLSLFILWLVAIAIARPGVKLDSERFALVLCAVAGLLSYLIQQKGFAYQRYPFLAFLLVLIAGDFVTLAKTRTATRLIGISGLIASAIFCTIFLARITKFDRGEPDRPLLHDLKSLNVADGQVQCMDTAGSCIDNLYAGQIVQSTGFLYDCYLFDGTNPVALDLRKRFWRAIDRNPPRLIVVTDSACYDPAPTFDKFTRWPEFTNYLAVNYTVARTSGPQRPVRYWSRAVTPFAYRIYVHR
jgi:hypothetical protein